MKRWILLLPLLLSTRPVWAEPTRVFVVRHAEKQLEPKSDDPPLTAAGERRAQALARMLRDVKPAALYATEYQRTQKTLAPLAALLGLTVQKSDSKKPQDLAKRILASHPGQAVAVAAHSNTVPDLLRALGAAEAPPIDDADYDNLFVLILEEKRAPLLLRLHYPE